MLQKISIVCLCHKYTFSNTINTVKHYILKTNFNHIAHPYNCIIFITGLMVPGHELMTRIQTELERTKKYEIRKRTTVTREIMNNQTTLVYRKTKL